MIRVKLLDPQARLQTRGSAKAAGHHLYANEDKTITAQGQEVVATRIAITRPKGTYGRIAPRSGMAVKRLISVNAGVIDSDYTGEIKVGLAHMSDQDYQIQKCYRIAQLIAEKSSRKQLLPNFQTGKDRQKTTRIWKHGNFQSTDV